MTQPDLDQLTPDQIANMPGDQLLRLAADAAAEDLDALGEHADDEDRALGAIFEAAAQAARQRLLEGVNGVNLPPR